MLRKAMARRLVFARWLQFGEELAGDHGLGKWFLLWFGEMYTMAALTCVNRNTRKARILQCDRCKEVWVFNGFGADPYWFQELERLKYMARCRRCTREEPVFDNIYVQAEVTFWGTSCRKCRMYVHEDTFVHEFFVCPVARQGKPAEVPLASGSEATDSSDLSDDEWLERENQAYHKWVARNQAIMQRVQREIYAYQDLQRDLRVSGLADQALQHQERRLSVLVWLAGRFNTDPISTILLHNMCDHVAVLARRP